MKIHFFGCSFTEGSGLDILEYYNKKTNSNLLGYFGENNTILLKFKEENRYTNIVKKLMNCDVENHAVVMNSNQNIINKLFETINKNTITSNDIFIIQLSIFSRKYVWYEPTKSFYNLNNFNIKNKPYDNKKEMKPLKNFYESYLNYCHNDVYEIDKLLTYIDLFNSYCKEKNIKIFWMPWSEMSVSENMQNFYDINQQLKNKNFIFFENLAMGTFVNFKKYTIKDEYDDIFDGHKSLDGHKIIANIIVDTLNKKI